MSTTFLAPGVWGIIATPFAGPALDVDKGSLARLVEHYQRIGARGLTVLGVLGEASRLSRAERRAVVEVVCEAVDLPLVVGATGLATAPVIEEAQLVREVAGDRAAGVMIQVHSPQPKVVADHLNAVHEATGLGIVVQDHPASSGVSIRTADLASVIGDVPSTVAVKAEAPPTPAAIAALTAGTGVPVFGGLGGVGLLDELAAGAVGAMTGFSLPEGLIACVDAYRQGGFEAAREAYLPYLPLVNFEAPAGMGLAIRKEILRQRGLITESRVRAPGPGLPDALVPLLRRHLAAAPALAVA
jgi:4-hydroxy-tetrahydrodipicolinate synthase